MRFLILILTYLTFIVGTFVTPCVAETPQKNQPTIDHDRPTSLSPVMKRINGRMHEAIRGAIAHARQDLGPLIIFEAGHIKLLRKNKEVAAFPIRPPIVYQQLKVLGHMAFATVIQLNRSDLTSTEIKTWVTKLQADILILESELASLGGPPELDAFNRQLIKRTLRLLKQAETLPITKEMLSQYSIEIMPALKAGITHSARAQVDWLHTQTQKLFKLLSKDERSRVRAHLYGGRGARVGNINIQYLSWLFGEGTGRESTRIVFSENISDHDKALDHFARYTTESMLADLIFKDPNQLDRDLLSEATRKYISTFGDPSIILNQ